MMFFDLQMTPKDHFDTTTDDVKMTCKKCYRKLYPFNPKIGLFHVIKMIPRDQNHVFYVSNFLSDGSTLNKMIA